MLFFLIVALVVFLLNWLVVPPLARLTHAKLFGRSERPSGYDGFVVGVIGATAIIVFGLLTM